MNINRNTVIAISMLSLFLIATSPPRGQRIFDSQVKVDSGSGCMDIDMGSNIDGGHNVIVWPNCHGGNNQRWTFDGETMQSNSLCMQVSNHNVIAGKCDGGDDQKWKVMTDYTIRSSGGACLDAGPVRQGGGHNVVTYVCHKGAHQIWQADSDLAREYTNTVPDYDIPMSHDPWVILPDYTDSQAVRIDCLVSGADDEETTNRITVSWYTADNKLIDSRHKNGISTCHGANDEWKLGESEEAAYIIVSTNGSDGYLMDQIELYRSGNRIRVHGNNDDRGWCLSTDNTDHNTGDFYGHSVDSQCPAQRRFDY